jgi:hypothetical protein
MNRIARILVACALVGGCDKKKETPAEPPVTAGSADAGSAGSAGSGSAGSATPTETAGEVEVPTEVDFETDANAKITDKNLEAEVKAMEEQLAQ